MCDTGQYEHESDTCLFRSAFTIRRHMPFAFDYYFFLIHRHMPFAFCYYFFLIRRHMPFAFDYYLFLIHWHLMSLKTFSYFTHFQAQRERQKQKQSSMHAKNRAIKKRNKEMFTPIKKYADLESSDK
jgi:hypothetical protein